MAENTQAKQLFRDALSGRIDRREVFKRGAALGLSASALAALAQESLRGQVAAQDKPTLKVTYYDWIANLHKNLETINQEFNDSGAFGVQADIAPSAAFSFDVFVTEAQEQKSTWDLYIGVTPFVEMVALATSGVIEPWDPYIPAETKADIAPAIVEECSYEGQMLVWPFLLDVIVQAWNGSLLEKAGIDPSVEAAPKTWDEYIANAKKVVESGAAPFGCTFDFNAWRSLIPITHSISTDVYEPETGLFMWDSEPAVQAIEIMKQMMEVTNPDVFNPGTTDGGVNQTPDENAFAAQQVAYYIKYQNAPLRFAATWEDPTKIGLASLPAPVGGAGGTVFWDTGAVLLKYGANKEQSAEYMRTLGADQRIWEASVKGNLPDESQVGQLPVLQSIWKGYEASPPEWLTANPWAQSLWTGLSKAKAIAPTKLSVTQFTVAAPFYVAYLKGEESDAKTALTKAKDAVMAEYNKQ